MNTLPLTASAQNRTAKSSARRRVLFVSPHFPPINAPDAQRIRTMLPYLKSCGWEAEVLAVDPHHVEHAQDALLLEFLPSDISVVRTSAIPTKYTRKVRLGNLGLRSWLSLKRAGDRLLSTKKFDLVFFSTTIFPVMTLGPVWKKKYGVPYVLDFQDPWLGGFYQHQSQGKPPGGRLKYALDKKLAQYLEPQAMARVSHVVSVSPDYPKQLQARYPHLTCAQCSVIPFGAPESDYKTLAALSLKQSIFDPKDGYTHWVYVGRGGADMGTALHGLFHTVKTLIEQDPDTWEKVRLHFVGTSYAQGDRAEKTIAPIAQQYDLSQIVQEYPHRIPYFEAQQVLLDSHGILMIGSDDPRYSASKLYPAILSKRPIMAIFSQQSLVVDILNTVKAGRCMTFQAGMAPQEFEPQLSPQLYWLLNNPQPPDTNWDAFAPYTAQSMTQQLCHIFDGITARKSGTIEKNFRCY